MRKIHGERPISLDFSAKEWALLNHYQHHFPLVSRPFLAIAQKEHWAESEVLGFYKKMMEEGIISRIGAVIKPNILGKSILVAMKIPPEKIDAIGNAISVYHEINHNYQRANAWNLWFVVVSQTAESLDDFLSNLKKRFPFPLIKLPLVREFHIDLGFDLQNRSAKNLSISTKNADFKTHNVPLLKALQNGLSLDFLPFQKIADDFGIPESEIFLTIKNAFENGLLRRFGIVLRHLELGYKANAMCVWQIPESQIATIGAKVASESLVTLCYERETVPEWRFNLYAMIHGKSQDSVQKAHENLIRQHGLEKYPAAILFHQKRYKQSGAHYA